jgi:hypothetical protein
MERLGHNPSRSFGNLAGSLHCAYADILTGFTSAFAHMLSRADRMQRYQISSAFANTLGGVPRSLACTFADVTAPAANLTTCASLMRLGSLHTLREAAQSKDLN